MSSKSIKSLALVITICSCLAFYRGIPTGRAGYLCYSPKGASRICSGCLLDLRHRLCNQKLPDSERLRKRVGAEASC